MSANAQHFANVVLDAFRAARRFTVEQIVEAGGPSTTTLTKLRKAAEGAPMSPPRGDTLRKIDTAANWPDGSAMVLWDTGELPDNNLARAIGSGGVPVPEAWIQRSSAEVVRTEQGVSYQAVATAVDVAGRESEMKVIYTPAADQEISLTDLGPVASAALKSAVRSTYSAGTRVRLTTLNYEGGDEGDDGAAPATRKPDSGPDAPSSSGLSVLPTAASKTPTEPSVNRRRRKQDEAIEENQDPGGIDPA